MKKIIFFIMCVCSSFQVYSQLINEGDIIGMFGFSSFEENSKHGIKFYGETVLYPQYDFLSINTYGYNNEACIGKYKTEGKYGIMFYAKPISKPIFDELIPVSFARSYKKEKITSRKTILAIVKINGKWGVTDIEGNYLLQPEYDFISNEVYHWGDNNSKRTACNIFFHVTKDGESFVIDLLGRTVLADDKVEKIAMQYINTYYRERKTYTGIFNAAKKEEEKLNKKEESDIYNLIDKVEQLTESYFAFAYDCHLEQVNNVEIRGKEGHIQIYRNNVLLSSAEYDKAYPQEKGVIRVTRNNKYGLVDCLRGEIIPCNYDYISSFAENDVATIMEKGFEGKVYKSGYISIPRDLLLGDLKTALSYAPNNLYLSNLLAIKLTNNSQYKEACELYDRMLSRIKNGEIKTKHIDWLEKDRKRAHDNLIGNVPQQTNQESGWDVVFGLLNSVSEVTTTLGQMKSGGNTSSASSASSAIDSSSQPSSSQNKEGKGNTNRLIGNYASLDRTYSNWESRLIDMRNNPEKYSKMDFSDIPSIQKKMKDLRERITGMGGTRVQSKWETWRP